MAAPHVVVINVTAKIAFLSALCVALASCASSSQSLPERAFFPTAAKPSAAEVFAAEACAPGAASCSPASGLVRQLGGATITDGVTNPVEIAFDASGNLYVSNAVTSDRGAVTVYAPGSLRPSRTVTGYRGVSYALALSRRGVLDVVSHYKFKCCDIKGSVAVYVPGESQPIRHLSGVGSFPGKPAIDAAGNLYVPNFDNFPGWINAYKPGARTPFASISSGIGFPLALTFDSRGQLYVLNIVFSGGTDVTVYAPGTGTLVRTITTGVTNASAIAVDSHDDLYVANRGDKHVPASVTVYAPGTASPMRAVRSGVRSPIALVFDASGNLYVGNSPQGTNSVTVYAPGSDRPERSYRLTETITALAVRPSH